MAQQSKKYRCLFGGIEVIAPRKVLHVIDSFDLGGAQTFLLDLVRYLDPSLFVAEVAAMHGHGVFESSFKEAGIVTHSLSPAKWPPYFIPNFIRLMQRGKFDILHFHLFGSNLCAKPLAIAAGHRAIVVHDQCNDVSRDTNPILLAADALANRGADRIIAVAESVRLYLLDHEDLPDSKVEMIPNGIDAELFLPASSDQKCKSREAMGLPTDGFVIGGVGRLVRQKNFKAFLKVASKLRMAYPEATFFIAGSGPLENELRSHSAALGLSDSVRFLGHVSDRAGLYHCMDALLMPSDFEGTPMTLLEAMASALPVIASGVDGIAEVCTDGHDALLVSPGDSEGYVEALRQIIINKDLSSTIGTNARRTILDRYEIRSLVRRIESIYDEILKNN